MKIRLAILEQDSTYLKRIVATFNIKYADKLELYTFTEMEPMLAELKNSRIDVLLSTERFEIDVNALPDRCSLAYLVEEQGVDSYRNQPAICKYQKADLIYKQILGLYAENAADITGFSIEGNSCRVISFISVGGGCGSSTVSVACARRMAAKGKRVLYLNLEKFGDTDLYFQGEGQADFSDIIYALRNQRANLKLKLESSIRQDASGVFFFASAKIALDVTELKVEDINRLVMETGNSGLYDYIVIDADFGLDKLSLAIWRGANHVILVADGEEASNRKIQRMYQSLQILEKKDEGLRLSKLAVFYNKFSNKTGNKLSGIDVLELGGGPRYEHATVDMVVEQLAQNELWDRVCN